MMLDATPKNTIQGFPAGSRLSIKASLQSSIRMGYLPCIPHRASRVTKPILAPIAHACCDIVLETVSPSRTEALVSRSPMSNRKKPSTKFGLDLALVTKGDNAWKHPL